MKYIYIYIFAIMAIVQVPHLTTNKSELGFYETVVQENKPKKDRRKMYLLAQDEKKSPENIKKTEHILQ